MTDLAHVAKPTRLDRGANAQDEGAAAGNTALDGAAKESTTQIAAEITALVRSTARTTRVLSVATTQTKNRVLERVADSLRNEGQRAVLLANDKDVAAAEASGLSPALLDRLRLSPTRLGAIAGSLAQIASLPDPVGEVTELRTMPSGLRVGRMRVPLGVIAMIYESRPNVTVEAAALALKSGNAVVLRGGKEAFFSNTALAQQMSDALRHEGLPEECALLLPTIDRRATKVLIGLADLLDVVIPRGGESLIRFVTEHSRVPVIRHYKGVCHVYVDESADQDMAERIVLNAKTQRVGVCNALETLLVDRGIADEFVPRVVRAFSSAGVEVRGDENSMRLCQGMPVVLAQPEDWDTEYLAKIVSLRIVDGIDGALEHVELHGSNHTEAIVTNDYERSQRWLREVDASMVLVNASTRFNDGAELGLGAEMGISTTKLHAYGAMGLRELCTTKWVAYGDGQIRE